MPADRAISADTDDRSATRYSPEIRRAALRWVAEARTRCVRLPDAWLWVEAYCLDALCALAINPAMLRLISSPPPRHMPRHRPEA